MDPRFRRRRVEVRRQEGRRRLRILVAMSLATGAGLGGWAATDSRLLDLDRIVVEGAVHTEPAEAWLAAGLRRGQPLVDVDSGAAARGVESLPWVERATVHRRWPGEVRIRLVEREPVAVIESGAGRPALVDGTGRVLAEVGAPPPGLALLTGLPPAGPPGSTLSTEAVDALSVAIALPPQLRPRVVGVSPAAGAGGEVEIRLSPEGSVRLGPAIDLDRKFDAIRAVLAQVDVANLAVLDVRRPDSPVLTRRETADKVSTPRAG